MSVISISGLVGDSRKTRRVSGRIALAIASRSRVSTQDDAQPIAIEHLLEQTVGAAVDGARRDHVMIGGTIVMTLAIAAMPEAKA